MTLYDEILKLRLDYIEQNALPNLQEELWALQYSRAILNEAGQIGLSNEAIIRLAELLTSGVVPDTDFKRRTDGTVFIDGLEE